MACSRRAVDTVLVVAHRSSKNNPADVTNAFRLPVTCQSHVTRRNVPDARNQGAREYYTADPVTVNREWESLTCEIIIHSGC